MPQIAFSVLEVNNLFRTVFVEKFADFVLVYGEAEFWFCSIKIVTIVGLIILGIVLMCGGGPVSLSTQYLTIASSKIERTGPRRHRIPILA